MAERLALMAVHAHPDDEVFATGGVLAKYTAEGIHSILVTCTGGEEGEIVDPTLDQAEIQPRLAEVRAAELRCAVDALGIETLEFLGYRDSGMAGTPANENPASFHMASLEEATGRLVRLVRRYQPQVLISYDENGSYGHPDHIKAHYITQRAFDASGDASLYPEAGPAWQPQKLYVCGIARRQFEHWRALIKEFGLEVPWPREPQPDDPPRGLPDDAITTIVATGEYAARKITALRCHRTQIRADSFLLQVPEDQVARAMNEEYYSRVRTRVEAPLPEDDLFAGLR